MSVQLEGVYGGDNRITVHGARAHDRVPQPVTVPSRIQQCSFESGPERLPKTFSFLQLAMANGEIDLIWTTTDPVSTNAP